MSWGLAIMTRRIDIQKGVLYNLYIEQGLSTYECAKILGVCQGTVYNKLVYHNIQTRNYREVRLGKITPEKTRQKLSKAFRGENHPQFGKFGANHPRYGKPLSDESKKKIGDANRGENSACWKGGISYEPYCIKFNNELKEHIREKYNRKCFICGKEEGERKLSIHHVDYNKSTLCNGKMWGLIPLCPSCHSKTNHNRWYWFGLLGNYWAMNNNIAFSYPGDLLYV